MSAAPAMSNGVNGVHRAGRQVQTTPELVGNQFVSQFYTVLHTNPQFLYRFYTDDSTLTHADGEDGSVITVKSQKDINDRVKVAGFQEATTQIWSVDSQYSKDEGVLVMVTGSLHCKGKKNRDFVQSFFLAVQDKGYFVLNDTFRYLSGRSSAPQTPAPKEAGFQPYTQAYDKPAYQAPNYQQNYHQAHASPHPTLYSASNGPSYTLPTPSPVAPQQNLPDRARGHAVTPSMHSNKPVGPPPPAPTQPALSHPAPPSPQPAVPPTVEPLHQEASPQQQPPPPPAQPTEEPKPAPQPPKPISQPPKPISQPPKLISQPQPQSQPPQQVPQPKQEAPPKAPAPEQAAPQQAAPQPPKAPVKQEEEPKAQQDPPQAAAPQKPAQPAAPAAPLTYAERLKQGSKAPAKAPAAPKPAPTPAPMQQTQASNDAPEATPAGKAPEASTANGGSPPEPEGPNSTIFVKPIPEGFNNEKLEEAFARFGTIKAKGVTIMRKGSPSSDFAFVEFEEVAAMHAAVEASVLLDGNKVLVKEKTGLGARQGGGPGYRGGRGGERGDGGRGEGRGYRGGRGEGRGRNGPRDGRFGRGEGGRGEGGRGEGGRGDGREGGRPRSYSGNFQPHEARPEGGKPENLSRPRPEGRGRGRGGNRGGPGSGPNPNPPQAPQQAPPQAT